VPARASCTEMLERSRECPICFHCRCYANDVSAPEESVADSATRYLKPGRSPFICPRNRRLTSQNRVLAPKSGTADALSCMQFSKNACLYQ
jgi:hypothetical protein